MCKFEKLIILKKLVKFSEMDLVGFLYKHLPKSPEMA